MKELFQQYKIHLIILLAICAISFAYVPEVLDGKILAQGDITQYKGAAKEIIDYRDNGERILWTNSQFSGMPTYQISGVAGESPMKYLRIPKKPLTWEKLFLLLFCSYLMFLSFRIKPWIALVGAVGMAFVTGNMTVIEAGHNTQALAIAYAPLIIGGVQYLFRRKWLVGFNMVAIGMALQLVVNHVQISYYTGIIIGIWMVFQLVWHIQKKEIKHFLMVAGIALAGVVIAVGANSLNLMLTKEYLDHTIRGKSEITIDQSAQEKAEAPSDGLARWYAFQWSNGWDDVAAMFIPNYAGGGAKTGLYYGALPFTSGPQYMGMAIIFLCILGFIGVKDRSKWWILTAVLLAVALSMGKNNFVWLNDFFFENVPFYNKFRAPTMALTIVQLCLPIMAVFALNDFIENQDKEAQWKALKFTGIGVGAFLIILTFFSGSFNDFKTPRTIDPVSGQVLEDRDQQTADRYKVPVDQFWAQVVPQRIELMKKDGYRSIFFAAAIFVLLWLYYKGNLNSKLTIALVGVFILIDFWGVDKRYLASENFKTPRQIEGEVSPSRADMAIMQDKSYYRVLDLTESTMRSSRASHFHKSIGGYNAAKLRRYQELFDWYIYDELNKGKIMESNLLNMLNMKYVTYPVKDKEMQYAVNPNANGNAWFVSNIKQVKDANEAIVAMADLNTKSTALIEQKFSNQISATSFDVDSAANIVLKTYHPEELVYESNSSKDGFIVFSEIYYPDGWNAYVDNQKVDHAQVDFVLRGLFVNAGKHEIKFKFEPTTYTKGRTISLASSGIIYLVLAASLFIGIRKELKSKA
ncbi:MAG: hypothetical protein JXR19_09960 [Bacteroidia bacterium]